MKGYLEGVKSNRIFEEDSRPPIQKERSDILIWETKKMKNLLLAAFLSAVFAGASGQLQVTPLSHERMSAGMVQLRQILLQVSNIIENDN